MIKYKKFILCFAVLLIVLSMGTVSAHMSEQPAVNIETPIHNTEVSGEVEIVATVDDHYTTEHVNFTIEGLDDSNKDYRSNYQDTNPDDGWKYTWDTTKVDDGRYYLQARAMNNLSLKGEYNILLHVANSKSTENNPLPTNASDNSQTMTNTTASSDKSFNFTQIYGTYIGGNGEDKAKGVFTDADGNIYIVMETNSNDLNATGGVYQDTKSGAKDLYVAKFDSNGDIIFATFIGGTGNEFEKDFKLDVEGNIYITGYTNSPNFPTTDNALIRNLTGAQSVFLTVLSADGKKLKYSTYLGGTNVDRGWALVVDDEGNAFVQGITNSIDFPVTDDAYQSDKDGVNWDSNTSSDDIDFQNSFDIFISEINTNSGELIYSTYFGGRGADSTYGSLAVKDDVVYFAGTTTSIDFHTTPNANRTVRNVGEADSFLAAINITSGELLYSSYIGGSSTDDGEALFISDDGFLYYLGDTWSDDFPTTPNAYQTTYGGVGDGISGGDVFAMKFDTSDWSIVYSTYLGGNADEGGRAIAVDDEGNLYIGGMSQSSDFPVTDDAFQKVKNGPVYKQDPQQHADFYTMDAILSVLSADGSELLYSTYIGGDYGEFIMGVELIDGGVILQFRTYSDDLWVAENAFQKVKGDDLYNPSLAYIGTIYEDYYANRTIYDMDTYFAVYLFGNVPTAVNKLTTEYTSVPTIQAGVNNTLTLTINNDGTGKATNVTVKVLCDNETLFETVIPDYALNSDYKFVFTDPTIRPIDENTVNGANYTFADYTVVVEVNGSEINSTNYSFPVLYNGNLGKDYAYPTELYSEIVRYYTITGDVIVLNSDDSAYMGTGATSRNETLTADFDGDVVAALLYVSYNWDNVASGDFNTWNVTFNNATLTPLSSYRDQGNLGNYGNRGYGLVVYNVADLVKSGDNVISIEKISGKSAVYPSSLLILTDNNESETVKDVYIAENADLLANSYSKNLTVGSYYFFDDIDVNALVNASLYVFAASAQAGEGNVMFNDNVSSDVWSGSSNSIGTFELDITDLVDEYNIVFFESTGSTILALHQIMVVETDNHIVIDAPDVEKYFAGSERFVVTLTDKLGNIISNESVQIMINGVSYTKTTDENGTASIALGLSSGVYDVTTAAGNVSVDSTVTILSTIQGDDIVKVFRNDTQYYATFTDSEGNPLANGTTVTFNINGVMYERKVNENGTARLNINLDQGTYILTAIHPNGEMASNNITVLPRITENSDLVKYYRNDSQYVVRIIGDDGNPVGANETVTFNINGVMYERKTNESGYAKLNINLQPGDYIITAMYGGCNVANNITVKPVLNATDITMTYKDGTQFKASLVDGQGNPLANTNVTFNINGVFYDRTTGSDGIAKLNINLMAGEYIITSMYNDSAISNKITIRA